MSATGFVSNMKDLLALVVNSKSLDEAKQYANQGLQQAQDWLNVGEEAFDPWLAKWGRSKWSLPLAVGFGSGLLLIGDILNVAHLTFGLLKLVF